MEELAAPGIAVNLDIGTMVANGESAEILRGHLRWIHHVHISESYLAEIRPRELHSEVCRMLAGEAYPGYVSLEMKQQEELGTLENFLRYLVSLG